MPCQRCQGLMVMDYCIDLQDGGGPLCLRAMRCLNCGDVVDPQIIRHRMGLASPLAGKRESRVSSKTHEVISVGN